MRGRNNLAKNQLGNSPILVVRLPHWLLEALDHKVAWSEHSRSEIVRAALVAHLDAKEPG